MASAFLRIKNLTKYFNRFCALQKIFLEIYQGEIFGLLGINGAGKTTLIKCILKLLKSLEGDVFYKDKVLTYQDIHDKFGYLPENFLPPKELTGEEFIKMLGLSVGTTLSSVISLFKEVELDGKKKIGNYSRGMIQRLGIATALLKSPEFIILDEPTLGLDPVGQNRILLLLEHLNAGGKTIFFSSHNLFQVQNICNRIGIIHQGRMKFIGTVQELLQRHNSSSLEQAFLEEVRKNA